jgi:hypothetical protein
METSYCTVCSADVAAAAIMKHPSVHYLDCCGTCFNRVSDKLTTHAMEKNRFSDEEEDEDEDEEDAAAQKKPKKGKIITGKTDRQSRIQEKKAEDDENNKKGTV